jgi:hypothetical protein
VVQVPIPAGAQVTSHLVQGQSEPAITATIVEAEIGPPTVTLGDTLSVTITVKNTSNTPLRTVGPAPGFTCDRDHPNYHTMTSPNSSCSMCDIGGPDTLGAWRVAVGSTRDDGPPYRWGLVSNLRPVPPRLLWVRSGLPSISSQRTSGWH